MRTLIVENVKRNWLLNEARLIQRHLPEQAAVWHALTQPPPSHDSFDRLIIGGSEISILEDHDWLHREQEFVARAIDDGKPVLGICFGHQMIARALWGKNNVRSAPVAEFGWRTVDLDTNDPLLAGLPKAPTLYCSHFQEVIDPPAQARVIAESDMCGVHGLALRDKPVWGLQFHPEMDKLNGMKIFAYVGPLKRQVNVDLAAQYRRAREPAYAAVIFRNFWKAS